MPSASRRTTQVVGVCHAAVRVPSIADKLGQSSDTIDDSIFRPQGGPFYRESKKSRQGPLGHAG
jgi:hypothetical protein